MMTQKEKTCFWLFSDVESFISMRNTLGILNWKCRGRRLKNRTSYAIYVRNITYFWQEMYSGVERPRMAWSPLKIRRPKGPGWTFAIAFAILPSLCIRNVLCSIKPGYDQPHVTNVFPSKRFILYNLRFRIRFESAKATRKSHTPLEVMF